MNSQVSLNKRATLIFFVILLLTAIVIFNFEKFTGQPVAVGYPVKVVPQIITAGDYIDIEINADKDHCLRRDLAIHNAGSKVRVAYLADMLRHIKPGTYDTLPLGKYKICDPLVVRFKTYSDWNGEEYFVQAQEWCRSVNCQGEIYRDYFAVE